MNEGENDEIFCNFVAGAQAKFGLVLGQQNLRILEDENCVEEKAEGGENEENYAAETLLVCQFEDDLQ